MANETASIRTAAARVRHLGSARSGTRHAYLMRATSLALLPLTIGFVFLILSLVGKDYATVRATIGRPLPAILLLLFVPTSIYHMKLGMQTIIEDYVHGEHSKSTLLLLNTFFCAVVGVACVYAILRLSFV